MTQSVGILEQILAATLRNNELLEALQGGAAGTTTKTTTTKSTGGKGKADTAPASKFTQQQVADLIVSVKDTFGGAAAKEILQASGFAKLADIKPEKFDELHAAATAKMDEKKDEPADDDI